MYFYRNKIEGAGRKRENFMFAAYIVFSYKLTVKLEENKLYHFRLPYANLIPLAINFNSEQGLMRHHLFEQKKKEFLLCIFEYKNKQQNKSNIRKLLLLDG